MPTDQEAALLQTLDGTPHAHLFLLYGDESCHLSTNWQDVGSVTFSRLKDEGWISYNGFGWWITQTGKDVAREHYRQAVKEECREN